MDASARGQPAMAYTYVPVPVYNMAGMAPAGAPGGSGPVPNPGLLPQMAANVAAAQQTPHPTSPTKTPTGKSRARHLPPFDDRETLSANLKWLVTFGFSF